MDTQTKTSLPSVPEAQIPFQAVRMDPKQRFYRHFLDSVAVIQDQVSRLDSLAVIGGERQAAIDHVLASVAKLQKEVADASEFTPAYDRRQYADAIKTLQDYVNQTIAKVTPKSRFQFKRSTKTEHVDMGSPENDPRLNPGSHSRRAAGRTDTGIMAVKNVEDEQTEDTLSELPPKGKDYNQEMARPSASAIRQPSFSTANNIGISKQSNLHIVLPSSASRATAAGSVTDIENCIIDMSVPTEKGSPFPGLAIKNVSASLVVAGHVDGPVHITGVKDSILVMTARQVRIHECSNVDIYLHCGSHPIIEDCTGMRFAPLPEYYSTEGVRSTENQWNQVDDFKWLKAGPSPNWTVLSESEVLGEAVWKEVVPGKPGASVSDVLRKVGIPRA